MPSPDGVAGVAILQHAGQDIVAVGNDDGCDVDAFTNSTFDGIASAVDGRLQLGDDDAATMKILQFFVARGLSRSN